jgi:hypothetical protein
MKLALPVVVLAASVLAACSATPLSLDPEGDAAHQQQQAFDAWATTSAQDAGIRASILEQHALYPYHFTPNPAALTELGQHDLAVLADAYKETAGPLVLVKADTPDDLYARRKDAVSAALQQAGIPADKVSIADGTPGGMGVTGNEAVMARKAKKDTYAPAANTDTGSFTNAGNEAPTGENK